jgi:DNA polymerase-3 subunit alpha/error-prone DNA polymerase
LTYIAENIGFEKFDILSQRIGHIDDTVKLVQKNHGIEVNIRDTTLSKNETKCNEFLSTGKTIGCFISKVLPCVDYCDGLNVQL